METVTIGALIDGDDVVQRSGNDDGLVVDVEDDGQQVVTVVEEDQESNAEEVVEDEDDDEGVDWVYFDGVSKTYILRLQSTTMPAGGVIKLTGTPMLRDIVVRKY
jgi:hypothetical protein